MSGGRGGSLGLFVYAPRALSSVGAVPGVHKFPDALSFCFRVAFVAKQGRLSTDATSSVDGEILHIDFRRDRRDTHPHDADAVVRFATRPTQGIGAVPWPDLPKGRDRNATWGR